MMRKLSIYSADLTNVALTQIQLMEKFRHFNEINKQTRQKDTSCNLSSSAKQKEEQNKTNGPIIKYKCKKYYL